MQIRSRGNECYKYLDHLRGRGGSMVKAEAEAEEIIPKRQSLLNERQRRQQKRECGM